MKNLSAMLIAILFSGSAISQCPNLCYNPSFEQNSGYPSCSASNNLTYCSDVSIALALGWSDKWDSPTDQCNDFDANYKNINTPQTNCATYNPPADPYPSSASAAGHADLRFAGATKGDMISTNGTTSPNPNVFATAFDYVLSSGGLRMKISYNL